MTGITDILVVAAVKKTRLLNEHKSRHPSATHSARHLTVGQGARMKRAHSVFALLVLLVFCVSLAVPTEDVPETAYHDCEVLPYESTPLFSITRPQASARTAEARFAGICLLRCNSSMTLGQRRREDNEPSNRVPDSHIILNHSFRC